MWLCINREILDKNKAKFYQLDLSAGQHLLLRFSRRLRPPINYETMPWASKLTNKTKHKND
jgi:hypothetical protein